MINPVEIKHVLAASDALALGVAVRRMTWRSGTLTAGRVAGAVKNNMQADEQESLAARQTLARVLLDNPLFEAVVRPRDLFLMFSRYDLGDDYGLHVDSAKANGNIRRDVSFTLFLSEPETYSGGDLIIEQPLTEERFKLSAGSLLVYPSTSLHRVTPVEKGSRIVAVGWARSFIRDAAQRELLFELDAVKGTLYDKAGTCPEVDVLSKCSANLMRMWMED